MDFLCNKLMIEVVDILVPNLVFLCWKFCVVLVLCVSLQTV
jgi:hypothetical protein